MDKSKTLVLLVEDREDHVDSIRRVFESRVGQIHLEVARNLADAQTSLKKIIPHLVISNYALPDGKGTDLLPAKKERITFPLLVLADGGDERIAVEVMKRGAMDYRVKSERILTEIPLICEKILHEWSSVLVDKQKQEQILKLAGVVQQSPYAILITDKKGNIEYVNSKFIQLTGYTLDDSVGKNPRFLNSGKIVPVVYKNLWETIKSGREWQGGFCNKKKNGKLYWESASISPIKNIEGAITHFVAFKKDITEQKRRKEKLLQSEKLKSLGIMISGIAHEFNNILAIIKGYAQFLDMHHGNESEFKEGLRMISKASDDGASIVRRMKDFLTADGGTLWFESVDINELIKHTIDYLMPKWKVMSRVRGTGYQIDTKGLQDVPAVKGSPSELREVLVNIINNALEAMADGGTLSFRTLSKGSSVFVEISDTGKGMSEEVQKRMFDPFFTTRMPEGTGLGMSAVYGIIKRHHGEISVESELGKGTTITLEMRATKKARNSIISPRKSQEINVRNLRVLVLEKEKEICGVLDRFFSKKGHNVKCVNSYTEAIKLLSTENFDLLLYGSANHEVSEAGIIKVLESLVPKPKIGVITGWGENIELLKSENVRADFIIRKPFDFSELSITINILFSD